MQTLSGGAVQLPAKTAGSEFDFFRGSKLWLAKVYDFRQPNGDLYTNFQFTGLVESPMVWGALGAAAAIGGVVGFLLGKRKRT